MIATPATAAQNAACFTAGSAVADAALAGGAGQTVGGDVLVGQHDGQGDGRDRQDGLRGDAGASGERGSGPGVAEPRGTSRAHPWAMRDRPATGCDGRMTAGVQPRPLFRNALTCEF